MDSPKELRSIPQAFEWAEAYVATSERPLLNMSQGVPGIPPPKEVLDALAVASSDPTSCGYLPNEGDPALRQAAVEEMKHRYGQDADVTADDIVITAGCNLAFVSIAMALADAGDEMILPLPWYVTATEGSSIILTFTKVFQPRV